MSVRVLVVDDSATMRALIGAALRTDPDLEIVGEAGDPLEARAAIKALNPDVVTLDIEMPNMNGLDFLERLMRLRPTPVVMVSTLTQRGADATLAALELGAIDCVAKPSPIETDSFERLARVVKLAAKARVQSKPAPIGRPENYTPSRSLVAIGASTGGVEALCQVLGAFPANCPPTVVTQHMPRHFTASFAARLDRICAPHVTEAVDGAEIKPGCVYLAPGGSQHLKVVKAATGLRCRLVEGDPVSGHRPSVDVLFQSVADAVGAEAVGVILTGMGRDGAQGLLALHQLGARTIGQDQATSVIYGMPKVAAELGAVAAQLPLPKIAPAILNATRSMSRSTH